ncbi:MAG: WXG100 family type VII secretion target [Propionibacteriaceae bacterium]|nr:WXG100 family type VII secretion target [Propionibacteriaceae bacterium]
MNPEMVDRLAIELAKEAQHVEELRATLSRLMAGSTADWRGADANQFRAEWESQTGPGLARAAQVLDEFSARARAEAAEQRHASRG